MYVCGITPYDSAHLGHILTFMTYDLLQRYHEDQEHEVTMARNITDVDEPIFQKAAELGMPYTELAARETASFQNVLRRLHFRPATHEPLASSYIEQMAAAVRQLLVCDRAYYVAGDIYFDTAADDQFGQFSDFSEMLQLGLMKKRGGDPSRPGKRRPLDFLLWKGVSDSEELVAWLTASAPDVPRGRPGWHIECSVMSAELLGLSFELHGGGNDLIFPHHECEIAQSRAIKRPMPARHWLHVAPLHYQGEKMSKSLGNLVFVRDLLEEHEPSVIRLALMHYHYQIGGEWNPCLLKEAAKLLDRVRRAVDADYIDSAAATKFAIQVRAALADNLDTHAVVHALKNLAGISSTKKNSETTSNASARASIMMTLELLGLQLIPEMPESQSN